MRINYIMFSVEMRFYMYIYLIIALVFQFNIFSAHQLNSLTVNKLGKFFLVGKTLMSYYMIIKSMVQ